jgi:mannosyltransferase
MLKKILNSKKPILGLPVSDWLFIKFGIVVFAVLTLWTITKSSIWFDEAFGAYMIHFNFIDIAKYTAVDVHPPLYYWLLKLWSLAFGNSELALRSMSTLFAAIAIIFGYLLTHRLFGKKAARISLIFMALSPMLIRYGQEARMYALVTAIALAATYALTFAIESKKRKPWIIYGILVSLGMWTHYFSAVVWIAHWLWRADLVRRVAKKGQFLKQFFTKEWILAHIVAIGLYLPWLPFFFIQLFIVQATGFWIAPVTPDTIINFLTNIIYYQDVGNVKGWLALGFIVIIVLLATLSTKVYKSLDKPQKQSYRLIAAVAFLPPVTLFVLSMPPMPSYFIDRYLITSAIGIVLFAGITIAYSARFLKTKWQIIITALIAALLLIGVAGVWQLGNYNKNTKVSNNTRQIIEAIDKKAASGEPIIAATPWLFYEATFYSTTENPVYFIDDVEYKYGSLDMLKYSDDHKIKDMTAFTKDKDTVWYLCYAGEQNICKAPYPSWQVLQDVSVNDSVSGKSAYKAVQYKTSSSKVVE